MNKGYAKLKKNEREQVKDLLSYNRCANVRTYRYADEKIFSA
jgi:hypothetical protein